METDSDSDGSHISATPPREPYHPSKPATPPPPLPTDSQPSNASLLKLVSSYKSRTKLKPKPKPSSSHTKRKPKPLKSKSKPSQQAPPPKPPIQTPNPISNPKPNRNPKPPNPISDPKSNPKHKPSKEASLPSPLPSPDLSTISGLSVRIRGRPYDQNQNVSTPSSIEILPANFCTKTTFFSKIQRACPIPDPIEEVDKPLPAGTIPQPHPEVGSCDQSDNVDESHVDLIAAEPSREAFTSQKSIKIGKRLPDFIGSNLPTPPPKRLKSVNEGNFVRLNINGYGRSKFKNKFVKSRYSSYSSQNRRTRWRSKSKRKAGGEGEAEGICDENGLVSAVPELKKKDKQHESATGCSELVEEAVMAVRNDPSNENLLKLLKLSHGYDSFREGQVQAIKQVINKQSTMLVLPTGAGKSLCYQLAALILEGLVLVVSPLVALMIDQLRQLPPMIQGGLLCSSQTNEEASETIRFIVEGKMKVLFVSPERFLSESFLSIIGAQPLISLVVVDEAHCLSEWSHNFRPSYLRLRASILLTKVNVQCILAMTATATTKTLRDVMIALNIPTTNLIQTTQIRENLQLSVSLSGKSRMKDLLLLLKSSPFAKVQSIIVYCKFQFETDSLSKYLRDNNINAKNYHSGIPAKDRSRTQELFCRNKIKVVVATVAFGMGLDKSDVGAVIHYSLPESLEEYVQEIGRSGRDGRVSYCHLFYDDATYFKLHSLLYSDGVDEYAVNKFLSQVFSNGSPGKICSLVKESASRKFDMKEEVILTVLTFLELGEVYLRLLPPINATCTLYFHKTSPALLAAKDSLVAEILKRSESKQGPFVFDIPSIANSIGVTAVDLLNQLHNLKSKGEITFETKDSAYCYVIVKSPVDFCSLASQLTKWLSEVEICKVRKLDAMVEAVRFAANICEKLDGCSGTMHTKCLQSRISDYFNRDDNDAGSDVPNIMGQGSPFLRADIKVFLQGNSHAKFTPRSIARIMHGIPTPAYPSSIWSKTHFWGRYTQIDFPIVMEAAKAELINFAGKDVL